MIPLKYAYFAACISYLILWVYLFRSRSDLRKAMITMSLIGGIASLAMAFFWTSDWWRPQTLTSTRIGIEDFILGFSNGGIASVIYLRVFNKKFYESNHKSTVYSLTILSLMSFITFWALYDLLNFNSFSAWAISATVFSIVLINTRRDLFKPCLINGLLMVLVAVPLYYLSKILVPEALKTFYLFPLQPDIRLYGVPIQELIFYFVFGFMIPLVYEYWHGIKLKRAPVLTKANRRVRAKVL